MLRGSAVGSWDEERDGGQAGQWHERFLKYSEQYQHVSSPAEQAEVIAKGLLEWAELVPQVQIRAPGEHVPANAWGLSTDMQQTLSLITSMMMGGHIELALRLEKMALELQNVAVALDECYPIETASDKASETRLSRFARQHAHGLSTLLLRMRKLLAAPRTEGLRGSPKKRAVALSTAPKRAMRSAGMERLKGELSEHLRAAADHVREAIAAGREPKLLPRPCKAELGRRVGLPRWAVSRCFSDPAARELQLLWDTANDLEAICKWA